MRYGKVFYRNSTMIAVDVGKSWEAYFLKDRRYESDTSNSNFNIVAVNDAFDKTKLEQVNAESHQ
jgi:hypothetical protein